MRADSLKKVEIIIAIAGADLVISPADENARLFARGNDPRPVVFGDAIAIEQGLAAI